MRQITVAICMVVFALTQANRSAGLLLVPMILPPFVSAIGMKMIFSRAGALSTLDQLPESFGRSSAEV